MQFWSFGMDILILQFWNAQNSTQVGLIFFRIFLRIRLLRFPEPEKMGHLHFHLTYFPNFFKVSKYRWRYCLTFFPKLATSIVRIMNFLRGFTNSAFSMFLLKTAIYLYETSEQLI